tara:strand:+ start:457 stop:612 length:156 start_codon:yes stop_codon:yes gene_type:complete
MFPKGEDISLLCADFVLLSILAGGNDYLPKVTSLLTDWLADRQKKKIYRQL